MSKQWAQMTHEELTRELDAGRKEAAKRIAQLAELMGMSSGKGRGRPSSNPLADLLSGGAGPETETDAASAVEALRD
jgi:hypothetical protein